MGKVSVISEAELCQRLRANGISNPGMEARLLLRHAEFLQSSRGKVGESIQENLESLIAGRLSGEPLSRIIGTQEFWSLEFELSPDTLDPRQDTETLVEAALKAYGRQSPLRILDIGTGSGCILISLLHEWPEATGVGTDLSAGAIRTAQRNAEKHGVAGRVEFVQTSWAQGIEGPFDLVVSNPPYIRRDVIPNLDENVRNYDPILALDGGEDGLDAYRSILTEIKSLLAPGGKMFFEIGYDQSESVPRLVANAGATPERIIRDSGGNPRVVECVMGISEKTFDGDS